MASAIPANEFVTDTIGLVLHLEKRRMGTRAKAIFDAAESSNATVYVPAIVLAEILYLSEKKRIGTSLSNVKEYFQKYPNCREYPLSFAAIQSANEITDIRELHDRLIAGTARFLNLELITDDQEIRASSFVKTLW